MSREEKLNHLTDLITQQHAETLGRKNLACEGNRLNAIGHVHQGPKYTRVDIGGSGRYMVVNETGEIFGIKGYGIIHRGHQYGTLDTVDSYYWGEYTAVRKKA